VEKINQMYGDYKARTFKDTPSVTVEELIKLKKQANVVLVDVRELRERKISIIPGAISKEDFQKTGDKHKKQKIITYCTVGLRSGIYAKSLRENGFEAYNLKGSILAWTHAQQPLTNDKGPTKAVHIFGPPWNLAAEGYEGVW